MTIYDIGLFVGMTIALAVFQLALARIPLWLLRQASVGRRTGIVVAHGLVTALLFMLMLSVDAIAEAVLWLELTLAFLAGVAIDLMAVQARRRRKLQPAALRRPERSANGGR